MNSILIAIFKSEYEEEEWDPYIQIIRSNGMRATIIPTLTFKFVNEELLQKHLEHNEYFQGIILSSARAVEAVHKVFSSLPEIVLSKWKTKNNYCIGDSTSTRARTLMQFNPIGEESGNSEKLCNVILSTCKRSQDSDSTYKAFLFPCSSLRRETIPKTLSENGFKVEEVICYEPVCNPSMISYWENLISDQGLPNILIFFSPSGVEFSHKLIKDSYRDTVAPKIIAIGPSTEKALIGVNLPPCKVSDKPNPEAVFDAIQHIVT